MPKAPNCKICGTAHFGMDHLWPKQAGEKDDPIQPVDLIDKGVVKPATAIVVSRKRVAKLKADIVEYLSDKPKPEDERLKLVDPTEAADALAKYLADQKASRAAYMREYRARKKT